MYIGIANKRLEMDIKGLRWTSKLSTSDPVQQHIWHAVLDLLCFQQSKSRKLCPRSCRTRSLHITTLQQILRRFGEPNHSGNDSRGTGSLPADRPSPGETPGEVGVAIFLKVLEKARGNFGRCAPAIDADPHGPSSPERDPQNATTKKARGTGRYPPNRKSARNDLATTTHLQHIFTRAGRRCHKKGNSQACC